MSPDLQSNVKDGRKRRKPLEDEGHAVGAPSSAAPGSVQATTSDRTQPQGSDGTEVKGFEEYALDMKNADVLYIPDFVDKEHANEWYAELLQLESCGLIIVKCRGFA
ncbi:hypothetical protein AX16_007110 [Volvariella volvacea WC 439]|nr:hypothetical protein AX16_007110 [Volvariella volvacea WC 439]